MSKEAVRLFTEMVASIGDASEEATIDSAAAERLLAELEGWMGAPVHGVPRMRLRNLLVVAVITAWTEVQLLARGRDQNWRETLSELAEMVSEGLPERLEDYGPPPSLN